MTNDFRIRVWEKLYVAGQREVCKHNPARALSMFREANKQAQAFAKDDPRACSTRLALAGAALECGRVNEARASFQQALQIAPSDVLKARALTGLGQCESKDKQFARALDFYQQACAIFAGAKLDAEHGYDRDGLAYAQALEGVSDCLLASGKPQQALEPLAQAEQIAEATIALLAWKANMHHKYLSTLWALGKEKEALAVSEQAWATPIAFAMHSFAGGDVAGIKDFASEAEANLFGRNDDDVTRPVTDFFLSSAAFYEGDYALAEQLTRQGIELRAGQAAAPCDSVMGDLYEVRGLAAEARGDLQNARKYLEKSVEIDANLSMPRPLYSACRLAQLAAVEQKLGNTAAAAKLVNRIQHLEEASGRNGAARGILHYWLSRYYDAAGDTTKAQQYAADGLTLFRRKPNHVIASRIRQAYPGIEPKRMSQLHPAVHEDE